ncbi:hypothetical protein, partial [Streptomyces acidiscabies]|nr:hypothetical protein [Streptomyces acidiscabies]
MTQPAGESVEVVVPRVPQDADVYRSWRQVVTGVDERAEGREAVLGPEVGHGATVAVWPGTVLLVVDQRIVRWERAYTT